MGESPLWVPGRGVLYWLDAEGGAVHHWDPESAHWGYMSVEVPVKALVRTEPRGILAMTEKGLFFWDADERGTYEGSSPERGSFGQSTSAHDQQVGSPEIESPGTGFRLMPGTGIQNPNIYYNGAVVDRQGRLLVDTYGEADIAAADEIRAPGGSIFRVERGRGLTADGLRAPECSLVEIERGLALPKGMCVSPDGSRLYLGEMFKKRILVYDYDTQTGEVKNRRIFAEMAEEEGMPDGLTVDGEGFVWCAHWGGWRVTRYAPDGIKDRVFPLPVSIVTAVGFGGEGLGDLFVTTAFFGLSDEERESQPLAGDLFRVRTGVGGIAEAEFLA